MVRPSDKFKNNKMQCYMAHKWWKILLQLAYMRGKP